MGSKIGQMYLVITIMVTEDGESWSSECILLYWKHG